MTVQYGGAALKEIKIPKIILATHNKHKAREIGQMLGNRFEVLTMGDIGIDNEIIEDGKTIEENADIKVNALDYLIKGKYNEPAILLADDTGLFVDALDGAPGVYSARFAGEECSYDDNNTKLLKELEGVAPEDRTAQFHTSLALITPFGQHYNFLSTVEGTIATERIGTDGFGYDPVFIEKTTGKTYAQMSPEEKNQHSHRAKAVEMAQVILNEWMETE